jgi:drug/metabolite transporter (DMT)-like permease
MVDRRKLGLIMIFMAAILWGTTGVAAKILYSNGVKPASLVFLRMLLASPFYALFAYINRLNLLNFSLDKKVILVYGLLLIPSFNLTYFTAINLTKVSNAAFLLYTAPIFVAILSPFIIHERITIIKIIAVLISVIGVFLIIGFDPSELVLGDLIALMAGLIYSFFFIVGRMINHSPIIVNFYSSLIASLVLLPFALLSNISFPISAIIYLIYLVIFPTFLSYTFYLKGLTMVNAVDASVIATVEPLSATITGITIINESFSVNVIFGGMLILIATIIITLWSKP